MPDDNLVQVARCPPVQAVKVTVQYPVNLMSRTGYGVPARVPALSGKLFFIPVHKNALLLFRGYIFIVAAAFLMRILYCIATAPGSLMVYLIAWVSPGNIGNSVGSLR